MQYCMWPHAGKGVTICNSGTHLVSDCSVCTHGETLLLARASPGD